MQSYFDECVQSTYQSPYGPFAWAGETSFSDAVTFSRAAFHYQLPPAEKNFSKSCDVDDVVGRHSRGSQYELLRSVLIPMNNHGFKPVPLTKMLYSVIETAAILSYSRQVIYDLINSGQLRAVNPLGSKRGRKVPASEIIRFVDEQIKKARWDSASNGEQR